VLQVDLLGGIAFSIDAVMVRPEFGPAGRLLACYLFEFPGRVHRRERLADLFWGNAEPVKARAALNTALWRIRKMLDQASRGASRHLITLGDDVVLEPGDAFAVDTHRLEAACRRVLCGQQDDLLGAAIDLYGGPFMDGHDDDWILSERERLQGLFVRGMFETMRRVASQGRYELALDLGRRILALDVLRERTQQDVMLLLVLNGQRGEAIRAYQRLAGLLKSELGIEPMPDTQRLYDDIRSGDIFGRLQDYVATQFGQPAAP
jgi:DNA-binding SARP family transcriptional activator